ncbi:GNAT family N-acetyltransferase [archaeon]|nr:GNAT family N-acetyltransferase [archaeon]
MKNIIIEKATLKDIDFIIEGIKEICKIEKEPVDKKSELKKVITREIKEKEVFMAKLDGQVMGFLEVLFSKKEPYGINYGDEKKQYCWVNNMYVIKKFRKKGIGKLLFKKLEEICKKRKIDKIMLDVFEVNFKAHKFYDKIGFESKIHIMEKELK